MEMNNKTYVLIGIVLGLSIIGALTFFTMRDNTKFKDIDLRENLLSKFEKATIIIPSPTNLPTNTNTSNDDLFSHLNISSSEPYSNLMLYLSFDENVTENVVYDYTIYNLTGRVRNGALYKTDTPYGKYYDYDGNNDYTEVGKNSTLQILGNLGLSAWIRVDSAGSSGAFQRIITMTGAIPIPETETQNTLYQLYLQNTAGVLYMSTFHEYGAGTNQLFNSGNATITVGSWTHIAMVRDVTANTIKMYRNGNLIHTIAYTNDPTGGSNGTLTLSGAYLDASSLAYFNGGIDEVMIFNQTLTNAQVLNIYNNQSNRFYPQGVQNFYNQNLSENGQENMINISLTNYQHLLESNISAVVEDRIYEFDSNNQISNINITGDINRLNISLIYTAGNLTNSFYSPLVGNITITSWNESQAMDIIYPTFSNYIDDNSSVVNSGIGHFNVTVNDTNGTVFLEINGQNISASNLSTSQYNASYLFSIGGVYNYSWNALGNGTNKMLNISNTKQYTVNITYSIYELNYSTNYSVFFIKQNSSKSFNFTCTLNGALTNYNVSVDGSLFYTGQNNPYTVNGNNYSIGLHNMTLVCGDKSKYYQFENLGNKSFIILSLSDTQNYVKNSWYDATSQKILDDIFNWMNNVSYDATIEFMVQNGDVVDSNDDFPSEWNTMNQSFSRLNSLLEWFAVPGNHDYDNTNTTDGYYGINVDRNLTMWNKYFPANVYEDRPYWGGNLTGGTQNSYQFFNFSGLNYMVLNIEFCPNKTTMDEINSTLHANENKNVIINTHVWLWNNTIARQRFGYYNWDTCYYLNDDAYYPLRMWNEYFRYNDNIDLILSGHVVDGKDEDNKNVGAGLHINYTESGHQVLSTYFNYQNYATQGDSGAGYLNYYIIDHETKKLTMRTYSPYLNDLDNTGYVNLVYSNQNDIFYKNFTLNYDVLSDYEQCIFDGGNQQSCNFYPQFSNSIQTPSSPQTYSLGVNYSFNISIQNTNGSAGIEFNGVNYSLTNLTEVYNYTRELGAGNYNYTFWAYGNSSSHLFNTSIRYNYVVNKATSLIYTYINHTRSNKNYPNGTTVPLNATLQNGVGDIQLYVNKTLWNTGSSPLYNFSLFDTAGVYVVSGVTQGNENYTFDDENWTLTITVPSTPTNDSTVVVSGSPLCRYKKLGYYNLKLPFMKEVNCV